MVVKHVDKGKDQRTQVRPRYHTIVNTLPPIIAQDHQIEHFIKKDLYTDAKASNPLMHISIAIHNVITTPTIISNQCIV